MNITLEAATVKEVEAAFYNALHRYKEAETTQEVFIGIRYQANGFYAPNDKRFSSGGFSGGNEQIGFDYKVLILETVDGVKTWYDTRLGKNVPAWNDEEKKKYIPEKYYKSGTFHSYRSFIMIPYSDESFEKLTLIRENLKKLSLALYGLVSQEPALIEASLKAKNPLLLSENVLN